MNRREAEQALEAWASIERDELVRAARQAGVSKNRIHTLTGIARTTIDRILDTPMPQAKADRLIDYLTHFTAQWSRPASSPFAFTLTTPQPVASNHSAEQIATWLFEDAAFKALKLGTFLNTSDGQFLAAAVESLAPPLYRMDIELLVEALQLAAKSQHEAAKEVVTKGFVVALGVGVAAALATGGNA